MARLTKAERDVMIRNVVALEITPVVKALICKLETDLEEAEWERDRPQANSYPHMCRDGHERIGHSDSEHEMCPLCRARAERDEARRKALEDALWEIDGLLVLQTDSGPWARDTICSMVLRLMEGGNG